MSYFRHKIGLTSLTRALLTVSLIVGLLFANISYGTAEKKNAPRQNKAPQQKQTPASSAATSMSAAEAARFLNHATLGYRLEDIKAVQQLGRSVWIENQLHKVGLPQELYIEHLVSFEELHYGLSPRELPYHKITSAGNTVGYLNSSTAWLRSTLSSQDLLRQRIAWALSQIIVVANKTNVLTEASSNYYDMLSAGSFGSYEHLLLKTTYHPVMGRYLSYMGNIKADPLTNRVPDENYAREIMQLFTIGLWQLKDNAERRLDKQGDPIPTYSNEDIKTLARVFTGFWLFDERFGKIVWEKYDQPMLVYRRQHDMSAKSALNGYISLPENQNPIVEIEQTIKLLARHPNTAPFISKKLITLLVTSNPSSDYVERVVSVWNKHNGLLSKVIRAILLDEEAIDATQSNKTGRLKGPIHRIVGVMRAFSCGANLGMKPTDYPGLQWWHPYILDELKQEPLRSPSVFNFFDSNYSKPGQLSDQGLASPEFQIVDEVSAATFANYLWQGLNLGFHRHPYGLEEDKFDCDFSHQIKLLKESPEKLMDNLDLLLAAGRLTNRTREIILNQLESLDSLNDKVITAVFGVAISPEGAIVR